MTPEQKAARAKLLAYVGREIEDEEMNADAHLRSLRARLDFSKACRADRTFAQRFYAERGHDAKPELWT
jgi:hypothetical protein